jgi:beta-galactosidase
LRVTDPVWIDAVALYPDAARQVLRVEATIGNATGGAVTGQVRSGSASALFTAAGAQQKVELSLPLPGTAWDEFHPSLFDLDLELTAGSARDFWHAQYGVRQIGTRDRQFTLNGRPVFLRGTVECNIFPLTGYPPTDMASWERLFRIARAYGLNHIRFHSNCPPEAAFAAADRAGMMLQVELPVWTKVKDDPKTMEFMRAEGHRILKTYGNHPSFTMLGLGNEFSDSFLFLDALVAEFKQADPRRLYTFSADHTGHGPTPHSDYYVGQRTKSGERMRIHGTRFGNSPSSTDYDFSSAIAGTPVPVVAHELGQWVTYPDYREIARYTGVLKPRNLEAFRQVLADRGMADQAAAFQRASGSFAWLLYKEDIETALRTAHYGGVQLLQLEDFPGQGEALVGLLDSFWESKGILTPEQFRSFFSQTVPLARFPKYTWTAGENFTAKAEVAHYGERDLRDANLIWSVLDDAGREIANGRFPNLNLKTGEVTAAGDIRVPTGDARPPSRWRLSLEVEGAAAHNDWDVWIYPKAIDGAVPADVIVAHSCDTSTRAALAAERKCCCSGRSIVRAHRRCPTRFCRFSGL